MKILSRPKAEKVMPYDDYNSTPPRKDGIIGTITTQFGNPAPRHGWKLLISYGKIKF